MHVSAGSGGSSQMGRSERSMSIRESDHSNQKSLLSESEPMTEDELRIVDCLEHLHLEHQHSVIVDYHVIGTHPRIFRYIVR